MKTYHILPLTLLLGGCAAMQFLGLSDATGGPTETAGFLSEFVEGLTGIDFLKAWGAIKGGEALLTTRGRANIVNAVNPKTGLKSTLWSLASIFVGTHTPAEAKPESDPV